MVERDSEGWEMAIKLWGRANKVLGWSVTLWTPPEDSAGAEEIGEAEGSHMH